MVMMRPARPPRGSSSVMFGSMSDADAVGTKQTKDMKALEIHAGDNPVFGANARRTRG
jgi:hypothetical protein